VTKSKWNNCHNNHCMHDLNCTVSHPNDMIYLTAIGLTLGGSGTHLHTNNTQKNTIDTKQYTEQHDSLLRKSADHAPSLRGIPWHLPYKWGKSTEKPQSG
jgi:hypothetical protein